MQDDFEKLNSVFGVQSSPDDEPPAPGGVPRSPLDRLDQLLYDPVKHEQQFGEQDEELEERDYMPIRRRRDGKIGCLGGLMYFVFVVSVSIILACLGWLAATDVLALNKEPLDATITLPESIFTPDTVIIKDDEGKATGKKEVKRADIEYVATTLKGAGIIEYPWLFKLFCSVSHADEKLDPGTYELSTDLDYRALIKNMQVGAGAMVTTTIMFPEGYTMQQVFEKLEAEGVCSVEDLYEAAASWVYNYSFLSWSELGDERRLEGYLFPDTYDFYQGMQASSAINTFLRNFHGKLTADMYTQAETLGLTLHQAVIVASMVEAEAANDSERPIIASVIYNRLNAGIPLGIDATIQYILPERKDYLTESDTRIDNPYNTYLYAGLPPGPISNPGLASIKAALQPASTEYYYYALDAESGTHRFFETYEEHQEFVETQNYG